MIEVNNLTVAFGERRVLENVSISLEKGRVLGIVGESGSGKTMTALTIMGLLPESADIVSGSVKVEGREIIGRSDKEMCDYRGNEVAMIFQEPMTSLNPTIRIGKQVKEALVLHGKSLGQDMNEQDMKNRVVEMLGKVQLGEDVYEKYPHELSGGMRQRVMIAMGIICHPGYLLCDEPTTALDVTTQKGILELIKELKDEENMGVVFITHDLKLLKNFADEIAVMCQGKIVETGSWQEIFNAPKEEYTKKLISSIPDRTRRRRNA